MIVAAAMNLMACSENKTKRKAEPIAVETETVKTGMTEGLDEEALKQQIPMRRFGPPGGGRCRSFPRLAAGGLHYWQCDINQWRTLYLEKKQEKAIDRFVIHHLWFFT